MKIEIVRIGELMSFLDSSLYRNFREIPITRLRAISQAQNPRASADDVALIFAHEESRLLSYVGLLPDYIWSENEHRKIMWNSCWWANEAEKNNGAIQLFYLAIKLTNGEFYFPELTPHTSTILQRLKNFSIQKHSGIRGYLQLNLADILTARNEAFVRVRFLLILLDKIINLIYYPVRNSWKKQVKRKKPDYKIINHIDDEVEAFISKHNSNELFRRNKDEMNWIADYPWIIESNSPTDQKYAFSLQAKSFKLALVKVYENSNLCGFFSLLMRNGNSKLTYCYFENQLTPCFINVLYDVLLKYNVNTFLSFNPAVCQFMQNNRNPFLFTRRQTKTIAYPKNLTTGISQESIQDGDGDCAFV